MAAVTKLGREIYATTLARWGVIAYFFVCIFFGYEIDVSNSLAVSHIATILLLPFALFVAVERGPFLRRTFWGTNRDRWIFQFLGVYLVLRILFSYGNQYFFGQSAKVFLILLGFLCLKILDPRGRNVQFWMSVLPAFLAVLVAAGIVNGVLSHQITAERFRVGPYEYEYVSEFACLMFPLWLFSIHTARSRGKVLFHLTVGIVMLVGLVLTDARGPLIGTLIAFFTYTFITRKAQRKTLAVGLLVAAILIAFLPLASRAAGTPILERYDIYADPTLSGRMVQWTFLIEQMLGNHTWVVFGAGFGRLLQWAWIAGIPQNGGFYRPSITDSLLSAWVCLGVFGLLGYLYLFRYIWRRLSLTRYLPYRAMGMSLLLAYMFTDLFETHWEGTKMLWYVSFVFYLLTLPRPYLRSPERQAVPVRSRPYVGSPAGAPTN